MRNMVMPPSGDMNPGMRHVLQGAIPHQKVLVLEP